MVRIASIIDRQHRSVVTLYGYASSAGNAREDLVIGRARALAVAGALRSALARMHDHAVRIVTVAEGLVAGSSNRVAVVVR